MANIPMLIHFDNPYNPLNSRWGWEGPYTKCFHWPQVVCLLVPWSGLPALVTVPQKRRAAWGKGKDACGKVFSHVFSMNNLLIIVYIYIYTYVHILQSCVCIYTFTVDIKDRYSLTISGLWILFSLLQLCIRVSLPDFRTHGKGQGFLPPRSN